MKISLVRLTTKELATLSNRVIESSKSGKYQLKGDNPLLTEVEKHYADYDAVYTKQVYSGKGKSVAQADEERDRTFTNIKNFLWGYQQVASAPNADKAKDLYEIIKQFGVNLSRLSYAEETAQLKKLIEELDQSEHQEKLTALHLHTEFETLKNQQQVFETLYSEQAEANADLRSLPSATAIRKDLEKSLRAYLDFVAVMKNQPEWKELYQEINELVKAFRK